jgi:ElaB/YqjD/DUF883 family membrane-anchored ribosome-binding protein
MPSNSGSWEGSLADRVAATGDDLSERAAYVKEKVSDIARAAADTIDEGRTTTADGLETAASTLHDEAARFPGQKVSELAHAAAERVSTTADYVRTHDAHRMATDVERLVKNNPGASLLAAAVLGFFVGRAIAHD